LSEVIQPLPLSSDPEHAGKCAPFSNRKFKANVRVVDYFPHDIRDFVVGRRVSEYDLLSDCSSDEDSESDNMMDMDSFAAQRKWEWRFALVVEDADPDGPKHRTTLIVGNSDAQMLLNVEADACKYVLPLLFLLLWLPKTSLDAGFTSPILLMPFLIFICPIPASFSIAILSLLS
jgi:protection-of-telomeres protein 1